MSADVERVKALREAFVAGAAWQGECACRSHYQSDIGGTRDEAARRYPMPMVTVPRVAVVEGVQCRAIDGVIETRRDTGAFFPTGIYSAATVRVLADLLASPTVTVPADEAAP